MPPKILRRSGNDFTDTLPSNDIGIHRQTQRLSFNKMRTAQKMRRSTILLLSCLFSAPGTCLPGRSLPSKAGIHLTESLPSNDIQTHTLMIEIYEARRWDWLSCHEMHTKFHKSWRWGYTKTHRQDGDHTRILLKMFEEFYRLDYNAI